MPRYRRIKPEFFSDKITGQLSCEAQALYIGMWCYADDGGVIDLDPNQLRAWIFPYKPQELVDRALEELLATGKLLAFEIDGERFGFIPSFANHQRIDKPGPPKYPRPDEGLEAFVERSKNIRRTFQERSENVPRTFVKKTGISKVKSSQVKSSNTIVRSQNVLRTVDERSTNPRHRRAQKRAGTCYPEDFESLWKIYGRKIGKKAAYDQYRRRLTDGYSHDQLLAACRHLVAARPEPRYRQHLERFIGPKLPFLDYLEGVPEGEQPNPTNPQQSEAERIRRLLAQDTESQT